MLLIFSFINKYNNGSFFVCVCKQTLEFSNSNNIVVSALSSLNSQMFHIVVNGCRNLKMQGVKVFANGNSPNTDGIHVQSSSGVTILNSKIQTGDDCISIGPGATNLWIENIACGPGHGIR
jgi:polygalacturonase